MEVNPFERFIKLCGTVEKAANQLGTSHQNVSLMRNGRNIKYTFAQKIANYLWEKEKYRVNPLDLISPKERNEIKSLFFSSPSSIRSMNVQTNQVKCHSLELPKITFISSSLNQLKAIIIDENNKIIANEKTFLLYKKQNKKTVPAWKIDLSDLKDGKYEVLHLRSIFDVFELIAIGISLGKFIGNRQGHRSDLFKNKKQCNNELRLKWNEVTGRTDQFIANRLGFSRTQYLQLKKIFLYGTDELINQVRNKEIKISDAVNRIKSSESYEVFRIF
ncbi:hypothetical protein [Rickettsiella grylli]|uniref:Uncharacterized protein n=1 Tax=Rickettsiella grylli TaxID=59196 RepID=A8PLL9_9COXI|nr:hypothetical protein [Rickettsiella grylli]EDP45903.1 hypothetical protein RICGR_0469 [Rickettsiella grylli]